jgi:RNA polymerase sigma factor (sigma-70 family)
VKAFITSKEKRMDDPQSDQQVIEMYWQRSDSAIQETQRKYHSLLLHIAHNITASPQDAEECVNDTYLKLWNSIPPTKPQSLKNYAARITRNLAIDSYRKTASPARHGEVVSICSELEEMLPDHRCETEAPELYALINDFLNTLDRETRVLFVRRYWLSESISELSRFFGLKQSAVKMRLLRTREKIRVYLKNGGIHV